MPSRALALRGGAGAEDPGPRLIAEDPGPSLNRRVHLESTRTPRGGASARPPSPPRCSVLASSPGPFRGFSSSPWRAARFLAGACLLTRLLGDILF